jgi:hypothetical protein
LLPVAVGYHSTILLLTHTWCGILLVRPCAGGTEQVVAVRFHVAPCAALENKTYFILQWESFREVSGSRNGAAEDSRFLGHDAVWFG